MKLRVLSFSGSLRKKSYNTALLSYIQKEFTNELEMEIVDLISIPLFNKDVEDEGTPESVLTLKAKIHDAQAVLIASPEYNHSLTGVLKNTLDWVSRDENPLDGKVVGILGASDGMYGTVRGQGALRLVLTSLGCVTMPSPYLAIPTIQKKFDTDGNLVDEKTIEKIAKYIQAFLTWSQHFI